MSDKDIARAVPAITGKSDRSHKARRDEFLLARERLAVLARVADDFERPILERLDALLAGTDLAQLADRLLPPARQASAKVYGDKYLDISKFTLRDTRRARRIGLHASPPLSVLDIGAGTGTFCWVVQQFGHRAVALEPARSQERDSVDFSAVMRMLGVAQSQQTVRAQTPIRRDDVLLPSMRFGLVTAFFVMFDVTGDLRGQRHYWSADDYLFFLDDIRTNFLQPGGRVALRFNEHAGCPLASGTVAAHYADLRRLLEPFVVGSDHLTGITLDLSRADGWMAARTGTLPRRAIEDEPMRKLRKAWRRRQRASPRGLKTHL